MVVVCWSDAEQMYCYAYSSIYVCGMSDSDILTVLPYACMTIIMTLETCFRTNCAASVCIQKVFACANCRALPCCVMSTSKAMRSAEIGTCLTYIKYLLQPSLIDDVVPCFTQMVFVGRGSMHGFSWQAFANTGAISHAVQIDAFKCQALITCNSALSPRDEQPSQSRIFRSLSDQDSTLGPTCMGRCRALLG